MSALSTALCDYLALRRSLGYKLERAGELLADFVGYADRAGAGRITIDLAVEWAALATDTGSGWRAQRLGVVRCFARYLHAISSEHQIPPPGLFRRGQRPEPFLYSPAQVLALMAEARKLRSLLQAATAETLIGLLAVAGLRVGEVIRLDRADLDLQEGLLTLRNAKAGKSRHVPLHPSTTEALRAYLHRRDQLFPCPSSPALFISTTGTRLRSGNLRTVFAGLAGRTGLPSCPRARPRLGDLRHAFAVQTVLAWYAADADVAARLPVLSTYLGHISPASTYWYLSASPPLLAAAARRLETAGTLP
jgi:integrase/recombinase XerD